MPDTRPRVLFWAVLAGAILAATTAATVIADYTALVERFSWLVVILVSINVVGIAAAIQATRLGLRRASEPANRDDLILAVTRGEITARRPPFWHMVNPRDCREIDIMGLALRRELFQTNSEFSRWLLECLRSNLNVRVRIMVSDPWEGVLLPYREVAERGNRNLSRLQTACEETLQTLHGIVTTIWAEQKQRKPQVVLVNQVPIQQWMMRIDDAMIVSPYMQHHTGAVSPAFELRRGSRWFNMYQEEFDYCFRLHGQNLFPTEQDLGAPAPVIS